MYCRKKKESPIPACGRDGAVCVVWVVVLSVAPLLRRSLRTREMTMSEASKQPSTRHPVFGENTLPQPLMKSYSAAFPMRGENFGDRLFASWHSAVSPVCGEDRRSGLRVRTEGAAFPVRRENPFRNAFCFPVAQRFPFQRPLPCIARSYMISTGV